MNLLKQYCLNSWKTRNAMLLVVMLIFGCEKEKLSQETRTIPGVHAIIPLPKKIQFNENTFVIDSKTVLVVDPVFNQAGKVIFQAVSEALDINLEWTSASGSGSAIEFVMDEDLQAEEYRIHTESQRLVVSAHHVKGAYYAAQTLRQLLWNAKIDEQQKEIKLQSINVTDAPEYSWRGFHLDVSRHFFTKEYVKELMDWMSLYKMNKLHLHLTDDQGWRVQIDQYPLLTATGAWRELNNHDSACLDLAKKNSIYQIDNRFLKEVNGKTMYGGFYTKDDIKEIVQYAAERFIDVIPEIDMPGHMSAAIRAYPYLSCTGAPGWGNEFSVPMCPCNGNVMEFAFRVWDEIIELFPSDTLHIGADEVEKGTWESSADCQLFMKENNLKNIKEIQNYFVRELQQYLEAKGKKVVAWDDVIDGKVSEALLLMYWRDYMPDSPTRTAANGNNIVLTPWSWFYLSSEHTDKALEDLYTFNLTTHLEPQVLPFVKGFQSCVWTEIIPSEPALEYYVFPRFQVMAEVAWSTNRRDWNSFKSRLPYHLKYMDKMNLNYRRPSFIK